MNKFFSRLRNFISPIPNVVVSAEYLLKSAELAAPVRPKELTREELIKIAKAAGMKASIGKTTDGNYHPDKNAIGNSVPIEWLETFYKLTNEKT